MRIREAVKRLVWSRAGAICAFPECGKPLIIEPTDADPAAMIGDVAHIVGHSEDNGPRADQPIPGGDRDGEANLLLLCPEHHKIVDRQVNTYPVERLLAMKERHETWVREQLAKRPPFASPARQSEVVHSTLLAVDQLPRFIYTAPCSLLEREVVGKVRYPRNREILLPFIVREKKLISFADLAEHEGPFHEAVAEPGAAERHDVAEWARDENLGQWLVALLNHAIGKYAALLELKYDKDHRRHYFPPQLSTDGTPEAREVTYRPLNQTSSTKQVAWNPIRKKTGEPKRHWIHLAVGLRLHRVSPGQWVLAIRPEHRFTTDGFTPLSPKGTGKKSTSTKSRMFNHELLAEVQFWRSFLTKDQPRLILKLGAQSLVIDGQLLAADVDWPGVRGDAKPFANSEVEDDLFTLAAYAQAMAAMQPDAELEELELDDIAVIEEAISAEDDAVSDDDFAENVATDANEAEDAA